MAKSGMKRREDTNSRYSKNEVKPVPEIQGKAKNSKEKSNP